MKHKIATILCTLLAACSASNPPQQNLHSTQEREMTLGIVQRELHRGMSQADIAQALGSPNIVSKDQNGNETWIYDKVATEASYSTESSGVGLLGGVGGMVGSVLLLGIPSAHYDTSGGASASTQRTLTVVIKYDNRNLVDTMSYHSSRF